ncbi:hypothetical protein LCGC14_2208110 [marine sediment metagenome]|uniref:Uncharacterized protein n=1 Tax=marine sediment metagenome TaxID=412755 RepID=A0A0F9DEI4_9ZZZZ
MFKHKYLHSNEYTEGQLNFVKEAGARCAQIVDLYKVEGVAPTYTFPHDIDGKRQCWGQVKLHWWPTRKIPYRINYNKVFGTQDYTMDELCAVNQLWILEEAEIYKKWIDGIYPEENTVITKVEYPAKGLKSYPTDWDINNGEGSLWSAHAFWHFSWQVCYYIDTRNNKKLN